MTERLQLLDLPEDVKTAILNEGLPIKKAMLLKDIASVKKRRKLLNRAKEGDLEQFKQFVKGQAAGRAPRQAWEYSDNLKTFAKDTEGVHLYKDRISFQFGNESSLVQLLTQLLDRIKIKGGRPATTEQ